MHIEVAPLKPLNSLELSPEETKILQWIRSVKWEAVSSAREPIPYKAKVPQFYSGVQLYRMQPGGAHAGSLGPLEVFIKKLAIHSIINKQGLYPVEGHGAQPRYVSLKKADLDNLGVGKKEDDEDM